jgi:phosphoribosyl-AMP cyclohydrolase
MRRSQQELEMQQAENKLWHHSPREAEQLMLAYESEMSAELNPSRESLRFYSRKSPRD